jgi:glycosyltransferase involved in cell wall biosynthesis
VRALQSAGYDVAVIAPQDPAADARMRDLGVKRIPIDIDRMGLNPLADFRLMLKYRSLLKQLRPAAYLSYTIKPNIYGSFAAASLGIPAFPNVSGLGTAFIQGGALQTLVTQLYRIGFAHAPVVFFQNGEDRKLFVDRGIVKADRAQVLPGSGVDLQHFVPAPLPPGPAIFLFIGRLLRDKGVLEFVEAARALRGEYPEIRFQLLGGLDEGNRTGSREAELESWIAEGCIEHLGTTDDVRPFIAAATSVVLPSYREGLPRSLLEAGAMGRPLIATDVPGCRDVVEDGVNGYLCNVRDATSLAAAMRRLLELRPEQQLAMGEAARRGVEQRFSEAFVVRTYLSVLASVDVATTGS